MRLFWTVVALLLVAGAIAFGVLVGVHSVNATTPPTVPCHTSNPYLNQIRGC